MFRPRDASSAHMCNCLVIRKGLREVRNLQLISTLVVSRGGFS